MEDWRDAESGKRRGSSVFSRLWCPVLRIDGKHTPERKEVERGGKHQEPSFAQILKGRSFSRGVVCRANPGGQGREMFSFMGGMRVLSGSKRTAECYHVGAWGLRVRRNI